MEKTRKYKQNIFSAEWKPPPPILVNGYDPSVFPHDGNDTVSLVLRSIINIVGRDELFMIMFVYPGRL